MDKHFWDARYGEPGFAYGTEPNAYLVLQADRLRPGMRALAVGDGEGRNGVWLARQGLDVLSVDASAVGIEKARALATQHGVALDTQCVDLRDWDWPKAQFDVVAAIFVHFPPDHRTELHQAMFEALAPGGLLILEAFTPEQLGRDSGGPPVAEMLYTPEMLKADFPAAECLEMSTAEVDLDEGPYHRGRAAVLRAVIRRPAQ